MNNVNVSEAVSPDVRAIKDKLSELVRYAARSRLKIHTGASDVEITEMDSGFKPGRVLASNMVFILVSGEPLRMTFKAYFNTRTAKNLAFRIFGGNSAADISEKRAIDYFKEYANLVAGSVITLLENVDIPLGISLPLCTRGFYEVFSDYSEKQHPVVAYSDFWALHVNGYEIFCSAQFEIMDKNKFANIVGYEIAEEVSSDDEEMDFL